MKRALTFCVLLSGIAFAIQESESHPRMLAASEMDAIMGGGCFRDDAAGICPLCPANFACTGNCTIKPGANPGTATAVNFTCDGSGQTYACFQTATSFGKIRNFAYPDLTGYTYTTQTIVHCQDLWTCKATCIDVTYGEEETPGVTCDTDSDKNAADENSEHTTWKIFATDNICPVPPPAP